MAESVRLDDLRTKCRGRIEMPAVYVPDSDLNEWINDGIRDLWDEIFAHNQDFFVKVSSSIAVTAGTDLYSLPADFVLNRMLEVEYATNDWRKLEPMMLQERSDENIQTTSQKLYTRYRIMGDGDQVLLSPNPQWTGNIRVWYVYAPTKLSADSDTINVVFGWDDYVADYCAMRLCMKEETDERPWVERMARRLVSIKSRVKTRDTAGPDRIRDIWAERRRTRWPHGV